MAEQRREPEDVVAAASAAEAGATAINPTVSVGSLVAERVIGGDVSIRLSDTFSLIDSVQSRQGSPEEATAAVEAVAPPLAELLRLVKPRTPADFWAMVGVLIMALSLAIQARDQGLSEQEIARLIDKAVESVQPPPNEHERVDPEPPR